MVIITYLASDVTCTIYDFWAEGLRLLDVSEHQSHVSGLILEPPHRVFIVMS